MYNITIDLGGTIVKIGLLHQGQLVDCVRLDAQLKLGISGSLFPIKEAVNDLLLYHQIDSSQLSGVGLAFPGLVDPKEKRVISTNNKYDDACQTDLKNWVEENWNVPFYLDNDARLAVVGEWIAGAAIGQNNVVMITIGTGIGSGVIIDGKVLYGQHYQAGALGGHLIIDYKGRICSCGNKGCVEALSSSFFLPAIIREHPRLSGSFREMYAGADFKVIFSLARQGNEDAILLRDECMDAWGAVIINLIHAYDPEVVIMGGGIMNSEAVIIPYIKDKIDRYAWCPSAKIPVKRASLRENAALIGLDYCLKQQACINN